ncbi:MAG: type II toxin-antitoxin system ParD family antitoxin [Corynebacterium sp.]|nr:type II toxin-antitoxin system ParD family antitoxin [Corynebacterium sp.]
MSMPTNTSISLDEHFQDLLASQVRSGRFRNASEVIRDALRLFEERELRLAALRREVQPLGYLGLHRAHAVISRSRAEHRTS